MSAVSFPRHEAASAADLVRYCAWLVWLRSFDEVWCASQALSRDLTAAAGIDTDRTRVFEVPSRGERAGAELTRPDRQRLLLVGGGGARANLLAPVHAIGRSRNSWDVDVIGELGEELMSDLATACEAAAATLTVVADPARALGDAVQRSSVVAVPAHVGGSPIAVATAIAVGRPVVASSIDVHRELLGDGDWLVQASNIAGWAAALDGAVAERTSWSDAQGSGYRSVIAGRMPVADCLSRPRSTTTAVRGRRPSLAVITPLPPQRSGVADYSAFTLSGLDRRFDVSYVSNRIAEVSGSIGPLRERVITTQVAGAFDHCLHVLGNSHFHIPALEHLLTFGGAALAHDSRMSGVYLHWRGRDETARVMSMGNAEVSADDVERWVFELEQAPDSCYGEIAAAARPLFVHSRRLAEMIAAETGRLPVVLPFCPYRLPRDGEQPLAPSSTRRLRIGSFGEVNHHFKRNDLLVEMLVWLQQWGVDAELVIVGGGPDGEVARMHRVADDSGVGGRVSVTGRIADDEYRWWLCHVDAAVQVRRSTRPTLSGAILDVIAYGLPFVTTVASSDEIPDAPMLFEVPDDFTSSDLAEATQRALSTRPDATAEEARRAFLAARTPEIYTDLIASALLEAAP
jgi:glycosyltransferase involved in cell wall biosynthesis